MAVAKSFGIILVGAVLVVAITVPIILLIPQPIVLKELVEVTVLSQGAMLGVRTPEAGIFWGIPFGEPPVGEYRWRKPRKPSSFQAPYWNATYKRPACPQICDQPVAEYSCPHATDEDCLYLNVWVPSKMLKEAKPSMILDEYHYVVDPAYLPGGRMGPLPVMVWFYGGNFRNGAGSCVLYDGRFMASKGDVIVVTTNYRVAHLGFLVQGNGEEESKGNFGLWDQVRTMEWVNENIGWFGGDPNKVTLFGQSAGAESIGVHLTSDISKNLFHQVIMESNPFGLPFRTLDDAKEYGDLFAAAANCPSNDMVCLRSKSIKELEAAYNETLLALTDPQFITLVFQPWSPVIDGNVVPDQPLRLFMEGKEQQKPMMMGTTVDEAMIYVAEAFTSPMNATVYKALLLAVFKQDYMEVINRYPADSLCDASDLECDNRYLLNHLATEYLFPCPQRQAINSTTAGNRWMYKFNETWSFDFAWEVPLCFDKVCHAAELAYLFGIETLTTFEFTQGERELSDRMISYWTNYAKYGDPGKTENQGSSILDWPLFEWGKADGYKALELQAEGDLMAVKPYDDICDFWDKLDAYAEHF